MKNVFFVGFFVLSTALTAFSSVQKVKVPRLKTVGAFNHKVLAQTEPEFVEKRSSFTILRKFYIARWGVHRYEYGMVQYQCTYNRCEVLGEPAALKFYKECTGFKKNGTPVCKNLESARVDITDPSERSRTGRNWYTCEDYGDPCGDRDPWKEYPSRHTPEDDDLPTGI